MSVLMKNREVPSFNPESFAKTSLKDSVKKYLPINAQINWFWLVFPDGKIDTEVTEHTANYATAVCKLYANRFDPESAYICKASAKFGRVEGREETYAYYERAQTSAMGRALRFAMFGSQYDFAGDNPPVEFTDLNDGLPFEVSDVVKPTATAKPIPSKPPVQPPVFVTEVAQKPVFVEDREQVALPVETVKAEPQQASVVQVAPVVVAEQPKPKAEPLAQGAIPRTLEEAMNTVVSIPRFKGKTFSEVLSEEGNENIINWIETTGLAIIDSATRVAAQIIKQASQVEAQ